jgi:hypothetical protein
MRRDQTNECKRGISGAVIVHSMTFTVYELANSVSLLILFSSSVSYIRSHISAIQKKIAPESIKFEEKIRKEKKSS